MRFLLPRKITFFYSSTFILLYLVSGKNWLRTTGTSYLESSDWKEVYLMIVKLSSIISVEPCSITYCCLNDLKLPVLQPDWPAQMVSLVLIILSECLSLVIYILCQNTNFNSSNRFLTSVTSRRSYFSPCQNKTSLLFLPKDVNFEIVDLPDSLY